MKRITPLFMFFAMMLFVACDRDVVSEEIAEMKGERWDKDEVVTCECEISDADSYYTLELEVRNTVDYPYRNLYLFVDIETPDTMKYRDTLQLFLADNAGHWYGKGSRLKDRSYYWGADPKFCATTREIKGYVPYSVATFHGNGVHPFRFEPLIVPFEMEYQGQAVSVTECYPVKVRFPKAGTYKFTFRQGMRDDALEGIASFGLKVSKYNEEKLVKAIKKENKERLKKSQSSEN